MGKIVGLTFKPAPKKKVADKEVVPEAPKKEPLKEE